MGNPVDPNGKKPYALGDSAATSPEAPPNSSAVSSAPKATEVRRIVPSAPDAYKLEGPPKVPGFSPIVRADPSNPLTKLRNEIYGKRGLKVRELLPEGVSIPVELELGLRIRTLYTNMVARDSHLANQKVFDNIERYCVIHPGRLTVINDKNRSVVLRAFAYLIANIDSNHPDFDTLLEIINDLRTAAALISAKPATPPAVPKVNDLKDPINPRRIDREKIRLIRSALEKIKDATFALSKKTSEPAQRQEYANIYERAIQYYNAIGALAGTDKLDVDSHLDRMDPKAARLIINSTRFITKHTENLIPISNPDNQKLRIELDPVMQAYKGVALPQLPTEKNSEVELVGRGKLLAKQVSFKVTDKANARLVLTVEDINLAHRALGRVYYEWKATSDTRFRPNIARRQRFDGAGINEAKFNELDRQIGEAYRVLKEAPYLFLEVESGFFGDLGQIIELYDGYVRRDAQKSADHYNAPRNTHYTMAKARIEDYYSKDTQKDVQRTLKKLAEAKEGRGESSGQILLNPAKDLPQIRQSADKAASRIAGGDYVFTRPSQVHEAIRAEFAFLGTAYSVVQRGATTTAPKAVFEGQNPGYKPFHEVTIETSHGTLIVVLGYQEVRISKVAAPQQGKAVAAPAPAFELGSGDAKPLVESHKLEGNAPSGPMIDSQFLARKAYIECLVEPTAENFLDLLGALRANLAASVPADQLDLEAERLLTLPAGQARLAAILGKNGIPLTPEQTDKLRAAYHEVKPRVIELRQAKGPKK